MLRLADTSIRLYRKIDGTVSVCWKSYLMVHSNTGFRLSAYLNKLDCQITIADDPTVPLGDLGYTEDCIYKMEHMVHEIWASGRARMGVIKNTVGLLRVEYRLFSFEGQGAPSVIEHVVPVLARGTAEQKFGAKYQSAA